jgi:hypothetical protein
MNIGGEYRIRDIVLRHWRKLAADLRLDPDFVVSRVIELARMMPDHISEVGRRVAANGLDHPVMKWLATELVARTSRCAGLTSSMI